MSLLAALGLGRREPATATCGTCRFFENDPHAFEAAMPGLAVLSSALGSVRSDDGLCGLRDRTVGARASCAQHQPRTAAVPELD